MLGDEGDNPGNLWNLDHIRALKKAYDYAKQSSEGQALLTTSGSAKFFSNGFDVPWAERMEKEGKREL